MLILFKSALPNITLSYNASFELDSFHRPQVDHYICGIVALVAPHANFATTLRRHISSREKFKILVSSAPDHESEGSGSNVATFMFFDLCSAVETTQFVLENSKVSKETREEYNTLQVTKTFY